ncbi:MAG: hypothetical protein QNJ47_07935 [Nostocaceae cyanobacterium]|nr:hypothetical protein [Nostocaceae cyanobacterium]
MQHWAYQQGGFWDSQKWILGDFNGDGKDDLAKAFNDGGLATIAVFTLCAIQSLTSPLPLSLLRRGESVGRGKVKFVFYSTKNRYIDAHLSSGSNFNIQRWTTQQGGFWDAQKWVSGDFNGDGKDDLARKCVPGLGSVG